MRQQGHQNKRIRGRSRKSANPLTRSYESNGPDVKIRGTALHIAEKYLQLWRDAQVSDDRITAENYLQHAEHYFRMIAAAQQFAQAANQQSRDTEQRSETATDEARPQSSNGADPVMPADAPQPYVDGAQRQSGATNGEGAEENGAGGVAEISGQSKNEDAPAGGKEAGDEPPPARKRTRGTRGRGVRRSSPPIDTPTEKAAGDSELSEKSSDAPSEQASPPQRDN
jgi:hypothetical protein